MKTPSQNFAHHTEVKKHPFGVKTPNLATLIGTNSWGPNITTNSWAQICTEGCDSVHPFCNQIDFEYVVVIEYGAKNEF